MSNPNENNNKDNKDMTLKDRIVDIKDKIITDETTSSLEEKVSTNAKKVLIALFFTLFGIVGLYTASLAMGIEVGENLNAVFIAAVTGIITLGGTLVTNLWGK